MWVRHVALENFRSYEHADITLDPGTTAFVGENGAGKTNIIESLHVLARGASPRTADDDEMVRWGAEVARVSAEVVCVAETRRVETVVIGARVGQRRKPRRWLVDGAPKRVDDATGILMVVAFFPEDVQLMAEPPAARRRYLDAMLAQADRRHRVDTREYQKVLEQRNALLRTLREGGAQGGAHAADELAFWDDALCRVGAAISARRAGAVNGLRPAFQTAASALGGGDGLDVEYAGQVAGSDSVEIAAGYRRLLGEKRERELWQGTTLVGPHREDLKVTASGRSLPSFASRGEHRTAILALKLAEASWLRERSGDQPVFLLDDVLSELDPSRRDSLIRALPADAQVMVTAAFPAGLPESLREAAAVRRVGCGSVT